MKATSAARRRRNIRSPAETFPPHQITAGASASPKYISGAQVCPSAAIPSGGGLHIAGGAPCAKAPAGAAGGATSCMSCL